jgi:hypothetical protein
VNPTVILVEILITDSLVGGDGGLGKLRVPILEDEFDALAELLKQSRDKDSEVNPMFVAESGLMIDTRLVAAVVIVEDDLEVETEGADDPTALPIKHGWVGSVPEDDN